MDSFKAMPVGSGDCFILERDGKRIVVDGGGSKEILKILKLNNLCIYKDIDVVACTHNDCDHSNGLISLITGYPGSIKELWLPAIWSQLLISISNNPELICREFMTNDDSLSYVISGEEEQILLNKSIASESKALYSDIYTARINMTNIKCLICQLDNCINNTCTIFPPFKVKSLQTIGYILKIWLAAINRKIHLRWFQYNAPMNQKSGITKLLVPINSSEYFKYELQLSLKEILYLSIANEQSLVFYAPEVNDNLGVLFTADSDFSFCNKIGIEEPSRQIIATAPHHGSKTNNSAYPKIQNWAKNGIIWVRSGETYLSNSEYQKQTKRHCTQCNTTKTLRLVEIESQNGNWNILSQTSCGCQ